MTEADYTYEVARTGDALLKFKSSPAGKFLWRKADEVVESAKNSLATCNPMDSEEIKALQNHIEVSRMFKQWVSEGISSGEAALIQLENVPA